MGMLAGGYYSQGSGAGSDFSPTYYAAQASLTWAVLSEGEHYAYQSGAGVDVDCQLWVETTTTETYVRLAGSATGNVIANVDWFNTVGVNQGTPGVDENAMALGTRVDTVNIYTKSSTLTGSSTTPVLNAIGTYTNDDKTTFFNPTNGVNYGLDVIADVNASGSTEWEDGKVTMQVTFRKSGFNDLTVDFSMYARGDAESDSG